MVEAKAPAQHPHAQGWYPCPMLVGLARWFDGTDWTAATRRLDDDPRRNNPETECPPATAGGRKDTRHRTPPLTSSIFDEQFFTDVVPSAADLLARAGQPGFRVRLPHLARHVAPDAPSGRRNASETAADVAQTGNLPREPQHPTRNTERNLTSREAAGHESAPRTCEQATGVRAVPGDPATRPSRVRPARARKPRRRFDPQLTLFGLGAAAAASGTAAAAYRLVEYLAR